MEGKIAGPNYLLDVLLQRHELKNDAALAVALAVAPPVISKVRHGRQALTPTQHPRNVCNVGRRSPPPRRRATGQGRAAMTALERTELELLRAKSDLARLTLKQLELSGAPQSIIERQQAISSRSSLDAVRAECAQPTSTSHRVEAN
jgi:hypothetical protein